MAITSKQPPHVNGEMTLTEVEMKDITTKLELIRDSFVETDEQPVCDTFYITAKYNRENELKVNGDTVEMLLAPQTEEVIEEV